jgi:phage terminase large subunit-like protein
LYCYIEEIKQGTASKNSAQKIRRLEPLYRNGHIYHKRGANYLSEYEGELLRFPKGKNDDLIDSCQLLYELSPLISQIDKDAKVYFGQDDEYMVEYDQFGRPK